jgi:hypothetical protein
VLAWAACAVLRCQALILSTWRPSLTPCYRFCMTILKQAAFSIAFAVLAVAVAEYVIWILEQRAG